MPRRRKKRRGKRREPQQQLPRASRGREQPLRPDAVPSTTAQAERAAASSSLDESRAGEAADRTITGTVLEVEREFIWIETGDARAKLYASELMLDIGEIPADRYAPGDRFAAFAFHMEPDPESGAQQFSIRRAAPYPNLLHSFEVGSVIAQATVVNTYDVGIELDVDGVRGNALFPELPLARGESPHDRYQPGATVDGLFVWEVDRDERSLHLSVRRGAPGYVEALNAHSVGEVVSATVTVLASDGGLVLDVGGVIGRVAPWELPLADGESAQDRYAVGDAVHNLFVWQVDHDSRDLRLSIRRNTPGYVEALNAHSVGEVVSGTINKVQSGGLLLDIDGAIGWIFKDEALLEDDETLTKRYANGDPITAAVQHIDRQSRTLLLSARRIASALVEESIVQGATIKALVVRKRDGGIDVSVGGESEIYIPDYALSLRPGGSSDLEPGQEIDVVVMDIKDGVPTVLSRRRALDGWEAARGRLTAGVVVPNARIIPWADHPNNDGRAAIDLGPITGFIPIDERGVEAAQDLMSRRANIRCGIVIEELNEDVWTASVSETKFKARWRELVDGLPTNEGTQGEIIDIARGVATLDLGFGLLGEMPASELPPLGNGDGERIGEVVTVGIRSIDLDGYHIAVESGSYRLAEMIADRENTTCEFKAVFQGQRENESKEVLSGYTVARAMAGMMNRGGGHVLVGVYEDKKTKKGVIIGWEESGFDTEDSFAIELSKVVGQMLSTAAGDFYSLRFEMLPSGERIADIVCWPAERPIFTKKIWVRGARAEFFVRQDARTARPEDDQEMYNYIQGRFPGHT